MATTVFDGARSIQGHTPDLDLHCERLNRSALTLGMEPVMTPQQTVDLVREGLKKAVSHYGLLHQATVFRTRRLLVARPGHHPAGNSYF